MCKKLLDIKYFSSFPLTHYIEGHAGVFVQLFVNSKFHIQLLQQGCCSVLHAGLGKWANLGNDNKVTAAVAELMWLWQGSDLLIGDVNVCWLLCPGFMHPNYDHRHHTRTLEEELFHAWLCLIDRKLGLFIQCSKICMDFNQGHTLAKKILIGEFNLDSFLGIFSKQIMVIENKLLLLLWVNCHKETFEKKYDLCKGTSCTHHMNL